ncbi:hypothetical protein [Streptomyces venezuelae]|uniref:hypothetical protein n=1 Tax=Streptomyces venezuelae TaxID=54571 RepID=UPI00351B394E
MLLAVQYELGMADGVANGAFGPGTQAGLKNHTLLNNQASGTAVVIRPGSYPAGARGTFTAGQLLVLRDILADTEGVVRWGGDDRRPYEGLFYLDVQPGDVRLARVAATVRAWAETPSAGAGVVPDVTEPARRRRAARFS